MAHLPKASSAPSSRHVDQIILVSGVILLIVVLNDIWQTTLPTLQDYPNHLARAFIRENYEHVPFAEIFAVSWPLIPNLGFDVWMAFALQFTEVSSAGKIFLSLIVATTISGVYALNYAIFGRLSPACLLVGVLIWNRAFWFGFLGFSLGTGLVLLFLAGWVFVCRHAALPKLALGIALSAVLFLTHLYALALFLFFAFALDAAAPLMGLVRGWRDGWGVWRSSIVQIVGKALIYGGIALPSIIVLAFVSPTAGEGGLYDLASQIKATLLDPPFAVKFDQLFWSIGETSRVLAWMTFWVTVAVLAVQFFRPAAHSAIDGGIDRAIVLLAFAFIAFVGYFTLPLVMLGSANADWRLLPPLLLVVAAVLPPSRQPSAAVIASAAIATAAMFSLSSNRALLEEGDRDFAAMNEVAEDLAPGSRVLGALPCQDYATLEWAPYRHHLPTMLVVSHFALYPHLFARERHQPLAYREPDMDLGPKALDAKRLAVAPASFDYLISMDAVLAEDPTCAALAGWQRLRQSGNFTLYARER
ncbi:MAG: hypothetical protein AAFP17_11835 [Pseudomonadota bacterium]